MTSNRPSGVVTFLFTDIEGSTRIAQAQREAWEGLRDRHHAILRDAIGAHKGYLFEIVGDGFCVAFDRPGEALNAALKAQRGLQAEDWGTAAIRVRMGIHTGVAQPFGQGYRGYLALSSVARVMSAAHGGQVLLSQSAYDLISGDLPEDVTLRDLGEHRLKDLLQQQHLYQPVVSSLPSNFPPPRTLDARPHNLPIQLTSFVGRETELHELRERLGRTRFLTLTGIGGTGKTRLSLQVAAEVLDDFPHGVWLVELAPISDPALVPQAIASALRLREQPGRAILDVVKDHVAAKHLLLILDNCEHLLDASAHAADLLLHAAPQLRLLVTSREPLGVAGESTFQVLSLSLPASSALNAEALAECDAARLFIERTAAVVQGFQLADQNAAAIAEVCLRLDGIPLALELAAARTKGMTIEQIASRLDDRFRLLTGGSRTALPRQRTLEATIDWSYNLLTDAERTLFRRLSVFVAGWTLEAARSVVALRGLESTDVPDLLTSLVEKSLVSLDRNSGRYHFLETMREFAMRRLQEAGEKDELRTQHLDYWLQLVRDKHLVDADDETLFAFLIPDVQDLLTAIEWSELEPAVVEMGLELLGSTRLLWAVTGRHEFSYQLTARLVSLPAARVRTRARVRALCCLGTLGVLAGRAGDVLTGLEEALSIAREISDDRGTVESLQWLGTAHVQLGAHAAAIEEFREALGLTKSPGDDYWSGLILNNWAQSLRASGDLEGAEARFEQSLRFMHQAGNVLGAGMAVRNLALVAITLGNLELARDRLLETIGSISETDFPAPLSILWALDACSAFMAAANDWHVSARMQGAAEAASRRIGVAREPGEEEFLAPFIAQVRAALSESEYELNYQEGTRLSEKQALSEAQAWLRARA